MTEFKAVQLKTDAVAHVVVRDASQKLFDLYQPEVAITVAVPSSAEIKIDPDEGRTRANHEESQG